jgi:Phospholipase D-like domain at C-terminus of MIT
MTVMARASVSAPVSAPAKSQFFLPIPIGRLHGTGTAHARDIVTDTGWKIVLDRDLDIFQAPLKTEGFSLGDRMQEHRMVKGFYVTYVLQT